MDLTWPEDLTARKKLSFRSRSLRNLLRMGHCAPAVMKSILAICGSRDEWPVKAAAGLPGGIGDTGYECGGITSPLLLLGLRHALRDLRNGLPLIFYKGHDYFRHFVDRNGTPLCREIRGDNYRLTRCIRAVCSSPEIFTGTLLHDDNGVIEGGQREAYGLIYSHMAARDFHCAHQVFRRLEGLIPSSQALLDATSGYMGGTLFKGMTCSALAAGVIAPGLRMAEIEDSLPRVLRMIVLMKTGRNAFADHLNKFNSIMNSGNELARWFTTKYGHTQCRAITGCDFASSSAVSRFIQTDALARCQDIAAGVSARVLDMVPDN